MPVAFEHQKEGARFLAENKVACLADEPRVGKTGSAIMAADKIFAIKILIVTTASGRPVWFRAFREWAWIPRAVLVYTGGKIKEAHRQTDVLIVGWGALRHIDFGEFDLIILDESHYAKNVESKRTQFIYGQFNGPDFTPNIIARGDYIWCLTGTPLPNSPYDLFPMLRALAPERLSTTHGPTEVMSASSFLQRYCITYRKRLSRWKSIDVILKGRNLPELKARLDGFLLPRTQKDVGITEPIYDLMPVSVTEAQRREMERNLDVDVEEILDAAETGETNSLDIHLASLRKATGRIKAVGVLQAIRDELQGGMDAVVVMAWHRETLDFLEDSLADVGTVRVDGSTLPNARDERATRFQAGKVPIFLGQIVACGEAIDLSRSAELIFAESSFQPKDMKQAALRITNHGQTRQPRVRVAALEGSIDEALQSILIRKVETIRGVLQ